MEFINTGYCNEKDIYQIENFNDLTHFTPMLYFDTIWNGQNASGFLTFSMSFRENMDQKISKYIYIYIYTHTHTVSKLFCVLNTLQIANFINLSATYSLSYTTLTVTVQVLWKPSVAKWCPLDYDILIL